MLPGQVEPIEVSSPAVSIPIATEECPVCLEEIGGDAETTICGHSYHRGCLNQWLQSARTCPVCRKTLVDPVEIPTLSYPSYVTEGCRVCASSCGCFLAFAMLMYLIFRIPR